MAVNPKSLANLIPGANPGGRPKGLETLVRAITNDGKEIVETMHQIATGKLKIERKSVDESGKVSTAKVTPSHKDRVAALEWLADRGFGKSKDTLEVSGPDGANLQIIVAQILNK